MSLRPSGFIYLVLVILILLGAIFWGGGSQECCKPEGILTFAEIDWGIEPAKYVDCCDGTEVVLKVYNYSDKPSSFDVDGEIITVMPAFYLPLANVFVGGSSILTIQAVDDGDEFAKISVMKLGQGDVRMRLWLKIEFR